MSEHITHDTNTSLLSAPELRKCFIVSIKSVGVSVYRIREVAWFQRIAFLWTSLSTFGLNALLKCIQRKLVQIRMRPMLRGLQESAAPV